MALLDKLKRQYARLLIREGVNLQPGQRLVLTSPVEAAEFARLCAGEAYDAGCGEVILRWQDDAMTRMKYLRAADAVFDRVNPWDALLPETCSAEGAAWLVLDAENPDNLRGADIERLRRARIASGNALRAFRERETRNEFPWCIAGVATPGWAGAVFPALSPAEATERLWGEILRACRVTPEADAVEAWQAHSEELKTRVEKLNELDFQTLRYRNALGTDLTLALPEGHFWAGGAEKCVKSGLMFSPNLPTEEVFTLPERESAEGVVYASRPLVYDGTLIEGLRFTFARGRIAEVSARQGEAVLRGAVSVDEGAAYLGEVALVPHDSPISASGILFYSTLFDENASCHFAFGDSYPCIRGAETMTAEELRARGANSSMTHVDFMLGSADLSVVGTTRDGREVPVMENGRFVL